MCIMSNTCVQDIKAPPAAQLFVDSAEGRDHVSGDVPSEQEAHLFEFEDRFATHLFQMRFDVEDVKKGDPGISMTDSGDTYTEEKIETPKKLLVIEKEVIRNDDMQNVDKKTSEEQANRDLSKNLEQARKDFSKAHQPSRVSFMQRNEGEVKPLRRDQKTEIKRSLEKPRSSTTEHAQLTQRYTEKNTDNAFALLQGKKNTLRRQHIFSDQLKEAVRALETSTAAKDGASKTVGEKHLDDAFAEKTLERNHTKGSEGGKHVPFVLGGSEKQKKISESSQIISKESAETADMRGIIQTRTTTESTQGVQGFSSITSGAAHLVLTQITTAIKSLTTEQRDGEHTLKLTLTPKELGTLRIRLVIKEDEQKTSQIFFDGKPETLTLLRQYAAELSQDLSLQGFVAPEGDMFFEPFVNVENVVKEESNGREGHVAGLQTKTKELLVRIRKGIFA